MQLGIGLPISRLMGGVAISVAALAYVMNMATGATSTAPNGSTNTDPISAGWLTQSSTTQRIFPDATGAFQTYNSGTVSRNSAGLWHREYDRTNLIKNNSNTGAVAGSPGTLPTNWSDTGLATGITRSVVAFGTHPTLNLPYIRLRYSGTASSLGNYLLQCGANSDAGSIILQSVAVSAGGSGYVVGEEVTLASTGGTQKVAAVVRVDAVSGGAITACSIILPGSFSVAPTSNPIGQASTTGTGTGATFTVTYGQSYQAWSAWLAYADKTALPNSVKARLQTTFVTSVGGASGAAQVGEDMLLQRDTTPRRINVVTTAPVPGTGA